MNELIAADEVIGTDVFCTDGRKLGRVENVMIDKVSGKALYAILSFGGFLGIAAAYYPLPWAKLKYDDSCGGYMVDLSPEVLARAPTYDRTGRTGGGHERTPEIDKLSRPPSSFMD